MRAQNKINIINIVNVVTIDEAVMISLMAMVGNWKNVANKLCTRNPDSYYMK